MVQVPQVLKSAWNQAGSVVASAAYSVADLTKGAGRSLFMSKATPSQLPSYFKSPLSHDITDKLFHACDKQKNFFKTTYKVLMVVSLALPLLAVLEFTVVNPLRLTVGNLGTLASRISAERKNKNAPYSVSYAKISILASILLGVSAAYKFGIWPFSSSAETAAVEEGSSLLAKLGLVGLVAGGVGTVYLCAKTNVLNYFHKNTHSAGGQQAPQFGSCNGANSNAQAEQKS